MSCTSDFDSGCQMRWSPRARLDTAHDTDAKTRWYTDLTDGDGSSRIDPSKSVTVRLIRVPLGHSRLIINPSSGRVPQMSELIIQSRVTRSKRLTRQYRDLRSVSPPVQRACCGRCNLVQLVHEHAPSPDYSLTELSHLQ